MNDEELDEILKLLNVLYYKSQKSIHKKEQTECESECSKSKIEIIKRKLQLLILTFEDIR